MADFSTIKSGLDAIATAIAGCRAHEGVARLEMVASQVTLDGLPAQYATLVADIDAAAAAAPDDVALQNALAEKDLLVTEFTALKAHVDAVVTAMPE